MDAGMVGTLLILVSQFGKNQFYAQGRDYSQGTNKLISKVLGVIIILECHRQQWISHWNDC